MVPFSADVLFISMLQMSSHPWACLIVASQGNWLGCMTTFGVGRLGRWDWIEKWFKVDRQKLEKQKVYVDKYGVLLALFSWFPFVGDVISLALGFYKTNPWMTAFLLLVGRTARFLVWALLLGLFFYSDSSIFFEESKNRSILASRIKNTSNNEIRVR